MTIVKKAEGNAAHDADHTEHVAMTGEFLDEKVETVESVVNSCFKSAIFFPMFSQHDPIQQSRLPNLSFPCV